MSTVVLKIQKSLGFIVFIQVLITHYYYAVKNERVKHNSKNVIIAMFSENNVSH